LLTRLKPAQLCTYIALLHESERYCSRELDRSDQQLTALTGVSARALRDARIKLQEHGLVQYEHRSGEKHRYVICDPATGRPYPFPPKEKIPYLRKAQKVSPALVSEQQKPNHAQVTAKGLSGRSQSPAHDELAGHGVHLDFK